MATLTWQRAGVFFLPFFSMVLSLVLSGALSTGAQAAGPTSGSKKAPTAKATPAPAPDADQPPALDLAPLVKEGTPGDLLMQDLVIPSWEGPIQPDTGSGTLQKALSDQIALPIIGTSVPGNTVQFRGLGQSAEATDVQALGIPLNPAQGGGFDLSIFPQFIWSSYEYQPGPALGTFDPRGTSGSLVLTPWTVQALSSGVASIRSTALGASAGLFQVSAAASDGHSLAAVVGTTAGNAEGPSGAFSGRWQVSSDQTLSFHMLLTDLDAKTPGPGGYTPYARQQTVRVIPLLQLDSKVGTEGTLKTSVFVDNQYLRYDDPTVAALPATQDHLFQVGTVDAFLWDDWTFGVGLRSADYSTLGNPKQSEIVFDAMASRTIEPSPGLMIEPTVRMVMITKFTVAPEGSFGVRGTINDQAAVFARAGVAKHFPSLLNRYYSYPGFPGFNGFSANPDVQPETDWTATLGAEWKGRMAQASLQLYGQIAQDAQVRSPFIFAGADTLVNSGSAQILSLLGRVQVSPLSILDFTLNGTLTASRLTTFGLPFPGQPGQLAVASVGVHTPGELKGGGHEWEGLVFERLSAPSTGDVAGTPLAGYHEEDVEVRGKFSGGNWQAIARLEDVLDQRPVLIVGYPSYGRTFSFLVSRAL